MTTEEWDKLAEEHEAKVKAALAEGFDALAEFHRAKAATARYNAAYGSEPEPAEEE